MVLLDDGPKNLFRGWFFFRVGWSQLRRFCQVPRGNNFSACEFFFAYFVGPTAFALACHGFANAITLRMAFWECFKSPDAPFAPFWMSMLCQQWCQRKYQATCGIPMAIPSIPKCDCTITLKAMAHWATLTLSQMLWGHSNISECVRKNCSQAEKFFLCKTSKKHCQCDKTTKKNVSEAEKLFWPFPTRKESK